MSPPQPKRGWGKGEETCGLKWKQILKNSTTNINTDANIKYRIILSTVNMQLGKWLSEAERWGKPSKDSHPNKKDVSSSRNFPLYIEHDVYDMGYTCKSAQLTCLSQLQLLADSKLLMICRLFLVYDSVLAKPAIIWDFISPRNTCLERSKFYGN